MPSPYCAVVHLVKVAKSASATSSGKRRGALPCHVEQRFETVARRIDGFRTRSSIACADKLGFIMQYASSRRCPGDGRQRSGHTQEWRRPRWVWLGGTPSAPGQGSTLCARSCHSPTILRLSLLVTLLSNLYGHDDCTRRSNKPCTARCRATGLPWSGSRQRPEWDVGDPYPYKEAPRE